MTVEEIMPLFRQPDTWDTVVQWATAALLLMMAAAILLEYVRAKWRRRQELKAEWNTVEEIGRERGLSEAERDRLRAAVLKSHPKEPLRAVTVRQEFDRVVEKEMSALLDKRDMAGYESAGVLFRDIRVHLGLDYVPYGSRVVSTRELGTALTVWLAPAGREPLQWRSMQVVRVDEAFLELAPSKGDEQQDSAPAPGTMFRCRLWRDDDARYAFSVPFLKTSETNPSVWRMGHTSDLDRVQTREYFRIRYEQAVNVSVIEPPLGRENESLSDLPAVTQFRARVTNLSAGGAGLVAQQPVPAHVFLRIRLDLPEYEPIDVEAKIVGTTPIGGGRWLVRASFVRVKDETREKLVRFVLQQQQQSLATDRVVE